MEREYLVDPQVRAWCRDCGAAIPDPEVTLRHRTAASEVPTDGQGATMHVTASKACTTCGSGRAAVKLLVKFGPEPS